MDVGTEIKRARIAQGLYIPELVYRTHIRAAIIEAIEANDFSKCGGDVYARGHVKALGGALGLDTDALLVAMPADDLPLDVTGATGGADSVNIWALDRRSRVPSEMRTWMVLGLIAVVVIGALIWQSRSRSSTESLAAATTTTTPTVSASASPSASSAPSGTPTATASSTATPANNPAGTLTLQLRSTALSWVRVSNQSGVLFEGTLHSGDSKTFASNSDVNLRIGNAAGIALIVNGSAMGALGASGQVYDHTFTVG